MYMLYTYGRFDIIQKKPLGLKDVNCFPLFKEGGRGEGCG